MESSLAKKIDAFEEHVLVRHLMIADILGDHFSQGKEDDPLSESGFAIMSITLSYFEMIEQFDSGVASKPGNSKDFFKKGFTKVFPETKDEAVWEDCYNALRNGMYHTAMPKDRCGLTRNIHEAFKRDGRIISINPTIFAKQLISHFRSFCEELRGDFSSEKCKNFELVWDSLIANATNDARPKVNTTPAPWDQRGI